MNKTDNAGRNLAVQEASEWLIRLQDAGVTDAELEAWGNWMARSPGNARAFDDVSELWEASSAVTSESIDQAISSRQGVARQARTVSRPRRRARWYAVAAMAAACGAIALGVVRFLPPADSPALEVLATGKGERRHLVLADGSAVDLDADTRLTVEIDGKTRELLLQRGRAYFSVAHDPSRPFRVRAGGIVSQAIGTRFSVAYLEGRRVSVVVNEGRVRVSQRDGQAAKSAGELEAGANERVGYSADGGLEGPRAVNARLAMSWREGSVVYQSEALSSVIEDLNRYSRTPLKLEDASMGRLLVTGRWESASVDSWVEGLASALSLNVVRHPDMILLAKRPPSANSGFQRQAQQAVPVEEP